MAKKMKLMTETLKKRDEIIKKKREDAAILIQTHNMLANDTTIKQLELKEQYLRK